MVGQGAGVDDPVGIDSKADSKWTIKEYSQDKTMWFHVMPVSPSLHQSPFAYHYSNKIVFNEVWNLDTNSHNYFRNINREREKE